MMQDVYYEFSTLTHASTSDIHNNNVLRADRRNIHTFKLQHYNTSPLQGKINNHIIIQTVL